MSVITPPAAVMDNLGSQTWGQDTYDVVQTSDVTGATATDAGAPPRWTCSLSSKRSMDLALAGQWEALVLQLRGRRNHLAVYDRLRPAPLGTFRGSAVLAAAAGEGATSVLADNVWGTLLAGDWLQLGTGLNTSQLVKLIADVTSPVSGVGTFTWTNGGAFSWTNGGAFTWSDPGAQVTLTFEPPIRQAVPAFSAVVWDRPVAYMKVTNSRRRWTARANGPAIDGFELDLLEEWDT